MNKHRIPLLDMLHAKGRNLEGGPLPKHVWAMIEKAKYNAARYVFDAEASNIVGEFAFHEYDLVLANRQFAIPPSPMTYVEVDSKAFFSSAERLIGEPETADDQLGYLVVGNKVFTLFNRIGEGPPGISYWYYRFAGIGANAGMGDVRIDMSSESLRELDEHLPGYMKHMGRHVSKEKFLEAAVMFGSLANGGKTANLWTGIGDMTHEWTMQFVDESLRSHNPLPPALLGGFMGDVRNYIALMLWLNQPQRVRIVGVPGGRRIVRGKQVPYLHHNTVTISLGGCKTVRRAFVLGNERRTPKLHDVKGHYRHRGGYKPCISLDGHDWPLLPDERGHWICKTCGRERWHVDKHVRGSAERGVVTKDYEVIP